MTYVDGFVCAVPADKKDAYRKHAADAVPLFKEFGATRVVETWGDDVPDGKTNDFKSAVKAEPGEVVVFSWIEYPDKATRDAAGAKIMSDPRMEAMGANMPFDGKRMIYAGFDPIVESGDGGGTRYVDGYLLPVTPENRENYRRQAAFCAPIFQEHGATRIVECWGDDVPEGKVTDYKRAVIAEGDERVVFSFVEWPSKEARVAGWEKIMADERMQPNPDDPAAFDGKRMIYGGFEAIVDQ